MDDRVWPDEILHGYFQGFLAIYFLRSENLTYRLQIKPDVDCRLFDWFSVIATTIAGASDDDKCRNFFLLTPSFLENESSASSRHKMANMKLFPFFTTNIDKAKVQNE